MFGADPGPVLGLVLAAIAGVVVGLERQSGGHAAGMRTHCLVSVGAALFTMSGSYGFADSGGFPDPSRVAAQVASGLGFIGAGVILREGRSVRGLTTAGTLWVSGALGVACGAAAYGIAGSALVIIVAVLTGLRLTRPVISRIAFSVLDVEMAYCRGYGTIGPVILGLRELDADIVELDVNPEDEGSLDGRRRLRIRIRIRDTARADLKALLGDIAQRPEVRTISVGGELVH